MSVRRRDVLTRVAGLAMFVVAWPVRSFALTGIEALDTAAIMVKAPSSVLLVAITRTADQRLVAVGAHGVIVYSDNNGVSWTQARVPVDVTLTCVAFATAKIGWAAGHFGVILNTVDGGASWKEQLNGVQTIELALQAAHDPSVAASPSPGAPLAARRAQHFSDEGPDKPFLTLAVLSVHKVIAFGAYRMTMLSDDGGKGWVDWSLHVYDKFSHNIYDVQAVGKNYYLVAEEGLMFVSSNNGDTFIPLTSPGKTTLFGLLGAKDGSLIVFGVAGFAARSTDGGHSWTELNIPSQQDLSAGRVLDAGTLVIVDEAGGLFRSDDQGVTFTQIRGVQQQPFFDIQESANGDLIAVGAAGVTLISKSFLAS